MTRAEWFFVILTVAGLAFLRDRGPRACTGMSCRPQSCPVSTTCEQPEQTVPAGFDSAAGEGKPVDLSGTVTGQSAPAQRTPDAAGRRRAQTIPQTAQPTEP